MIKYCTKVGDDTYLVLDTPEYIEYVKSLDNYEGIPLYITSKQKQFFSSKGRWFSLVTYLPIDLIELLLFNYYDYILHYIYIVHDNDFNDDNTKKKSHVHLLINTTNSIQCSFLVRLFRTREVKLLESLNKKLMKNAVLYLTHESDKAIAEKKSIYDFSNCVSDDIKFWLYYRNLDLDNVNTAYSIITDILSGTSYLQLVKSYGATYVINKDKYESLAKLCKDEFYKKEI